MTGIVKTDQIQGAGSSTVTVPTGNTLAVTDNATIGGNLTVDTNTLHVDASNNRVGIGTTSPAVALETSGDMAVSDTSTASKRLQLSAGASDHTINSANYGSDMMNLNIQAENTIFKNGLIGVVESMKINSAGIITKPLQPCFSAGRSSTLANIATNSMVTINLNSEKYDQNNDFSDPNFTAPVTGKYQLSAIWYMNALDISAAYYILRIDTSNRSYDHVVDSSARDEDETYSSYTLSVLADMDAGDTASIGIYQQDGAPQTDITAGTYFTGCLVA